jgi:hypothetical protein
MCRPSLLTITSDGTLFDRREFHYDEASDSFRCPAGQSLQRQQQRKRAIVYAGRPEICGACPLKSRCTVTSLPAPASLRRRTAAHAAAGYGGGDAPANIHRRTSLCYLEVPYLRSPEISVTRVAGPQTEISLGVMVYNLKRMINIMGASWLRFQLAAA